MANWSEELVLVEVNDNVVCLVGMGVFNACGSTSNVVLGSPEVGRHPRLLRFGTPRLGVPDGGGHPPQLRFGKIKSQATDIRAGRTIIRR